MAIDETKNPYVPTCGVALIVSPRTGSSPSFGGGVNITVPLGRKLRIHNQQVSAPCGIEIREGSANGGYITVVASNTSYDLDTGTYDVYHFAGYNSSGTSIDSQMTIEPIFTLVEAGAGRCPLNYTLQATDDRPRRLVGTFIGLDGRELRSNETQPVASFSIPITNSAPLPLGYWYINRNGSPTNERIWADVAVFRGVLYGGPLKCIPGGRNATASSAVAGYDPQPAAILLRPGPVVLGGPDLAWQPATCPGFYDIPISTIDVAATLGQNATPVTFEVDATSCIAATVFLNWTGTNTSLRVQAARKVVTLEGSTTWSGNVNAVDETFSVPASNFAPYVELDQGLWTVTISNVSATNVTASTIKAAIQRWQ